MRILAVSDVVSKHYYDFYTPGCLDEFDMILSCGDLDRNYLEFLSTLAQCPVVYVHGNHDDALDKDPPGGCMCAEDKIVVCRGVRILGLGGSQRYRPGSHMFTEGQMRRRVLRLLPRLWYSKGFDILLTHAPAQGFNDIDSLAHRGFECFNTLLDRYQPAYFVHGHVHRNYGIDIPQRSMRKGTTVINAFDHCAFDLQLPAAAR